MRKIIPLFLAILLIFGSVMAESSKDLQKKQDKKREEQKSYEQKIKDSKSQIAENKELLGKTQAEIDVLDGQISEAAANLATINDEIGKLQVDIDANTQKLNEAEANLESKEDVFKERIRAMYMSGDVRNLEILLNSQSVEDMLTNNEMIQAIARNDKNLINFVKEQVTTIKEKEEALKRDMAVLDKRQEEASAVKTSLEATSAKKSQYMADLEKNTELLNAQIDKFNEESKALESEIRNLTSEIARKQREERKNREGKGPTPVLGNGKLSWPLSGYTRISSPYGYRTHPILGYSKFHSGVDIPAPTGTAVHAAADGVVIAAKRLGSYGNAVMIDHGDCVTVYAHNSALKVSEGDYVLRGDTISLVGSTGLSTGPHLHFEVRINGATQNPMGYV